MDDKSQPIPKPIIRALIEYSPLDEIVTSDEPIQILAPSHSPFRNFVLLEPVGKVLYRDEAVIRRIYDSVIAMAQHRQSLAEQPQVEAAPDFYEQLICLEWSPRDDTNFDYLVFLLSSAVRFKASVRDLVDRIDEEIKCKSDLVSVYPGMPVRVCGVIQESGDISRGRIHLHVDEFSVRVDLGREHILHKNANFLENRFLFVLGIIQSIKRILTIKGGAVLL